MDTELSFVFIGVAYKKGLRNPEAEQLMNEVSGLARFFVRNRANTPFGQNTKAIHCTVI